MQKAKENYSIIFSKNVGHLTDKEKGSFKEREAFKI